MKALIHHNPACGTSRKTLEILRESGIDLIVNEYLSNPPSRDELKRLYKRAGISPREGLRAGECQGGGIVTSRGPDGRIYFATPKGVVFVEPGHMMRNAVPPPVAIESVSCDGVELFESAAGPAGEQWVQRLERRDGQHAYHPGTSR